MSLSLDAVTGASLPVAIALLILTAQARAVLWMGFDHPRVRRIARQYVEPLSTWCLLALAVHAAAIGAAGERGLLALVVPLGLGVAAVLLRPAHEVQDVEPEEQPAAAAPIAPVEVLWARPATVDIRAQRTLSEPRVDSQARH